MPSHLLATVFQTQKSYEISLPNIFLSGNSWDYKMNPFGAHLSNASMDFYP